MGAKEPSSVALWRGRDVVVCGWVAVGCAGRGGFWVAEMLVEVLIEVVVGSGGAEREEVGELSSFGVCAEEESGVGGASVLDVVDSSSLVEAEASEESALRAVSKLGEARCKMGVDRSSVKMRHMASAAWKSE